MSAPHLQPAAAPAPEAAPAPMRPAEFCRALLAALGASDGRRRRRKRNTTPDAIGMAVKRELLEAAAAEDPDAGAFEEWLFRRVLAAGEGEGEAAGLGAGGIQAMALSILDEWRLAAEADDFRAWLAGGAPSDDRMHQDAPTCSAEGCAPSSGEGE